MGMRIYSNIRLGAFGALAAGAVAGLATVTITVPTASAQPQFTRAELSNTLGSVTAAMGQYLTSHPDANQVVTDGWCTVTAGR